MKLRSDEERGVLICFLLERRETLIGKQKEKFISDVCAFVYLLTGTKYCIHLESTIAPKYIRDFYDLYSQAIILVEIK